MKKLTKNAEVWLSAIFLILMVVVIAQKENFFLDEIYSYGLANHIAQEGYNVKDLPMREGVTYEPASEPFMDYVAVQPGEEFNYQNVWHNQAEDVHPPLYYVILHTICSFFPNTFSIWYAGVINIVFALLALHIVQQLALLLTKSSTLSLLISVMFLLSPGILSAVSFFRMYIMAMFWVLLVSYLFLREMMEPSAKIKFYILLFAASLGSALTHYYCTVYLAVVCVFYGIFLLARKEWKQEFAFCITMGMAAVISLGIFPSMIEHVFSSYRGNESSENLMSMPAGVFADRLWQFAKMIDVELFGGILFYIITASLIVWAIFKFARAQNPAKDDNNKRPEVRLVSLLFLFGPQVTYFLFIAKVAVYVQNRYIMPIYAIAFVSVLSLVLSALRELVTDEKTRTLCVSVFSAIILAGSWRGTEWTYLYRDSEPLLDFASEHASTDCLYIYDELWKAKVPFFEAKNYKSITFLNMKDIETFRELGCSEAQELVVIAAGDTQQTVNQLLEISPELNQYKKIGTYSTGETYYLYHDK